MAKKTLDALPAAQQTSVDLVHSVSVGNQGDLNEGESKRLENLLKKNSNRGAKGHTIFTAYI